ncbi:MAG: ferritin-like domain-containing protein [Pseudobdellovibrionaceae bacterium]
MKPIIDIENLGFDSGAHVLIKHQLNSMSPGEKIELRGRAPEWQAQAAAWCRSQGHTLIMADNAVIIEKGQPDKERWGTLFSSNDDILDEASPFLGLSARGAQVEIGSPEFQFRLNKKTEIWSNNAAELYQQAVNAQWNANNAIDWSEPKKHCDILENAIVQLMTYMIENENAALVVPARFLGQVHPHFREIQALLSIQIADEARHIDVFTRRIQLYGHKPGYSTAGGQASLKTLLQEPNFGTAEFLLSVLGEGTFVDLLQFLHRFAPDKATQQICLLAAKDESRHVAFGMSHLIEKLEIDPDFREQLKLAVTARHESLIETKGLNQEVFDSLIILAAGSLEADRIAFGFKQVQNLLIEMKEGRRARLERLGFISEEAKELSSLHTRNFM